MKTLREGLNLCLFQVCLEISNDPDITWVLREHKCSMKLPLLRSKLHSHWPCSVQHFPGERSHRHAESVSEVNTSILETNICWASAPAAWESRFSEVNLPHSFLPGRGHSAIEINVYLWLTLNPWFRNFNWQNEWLQYIWRSHCILKQVKIIVSEKWKKTVYLSESFISQTRDKSLVMITKLL